MSDELPPGWSRASLRQLVGPAGLMADGDWVESKDQDPNGDVRLIQLADVGDGKFLNKSNRFLTSDKAKQLNCTMLQSRDVLISRLGEPLGKTCLFPELDQKCVTVVDVHVVRPGSTDVNREWLMHLLNSAQVRREIDSMSSGTTRKRITGQKLRDLKIPIPPASEQERITSKIDELFSRIDEGERALEQVSTLVERYRQSVLKAAVTGELTRDWREARKAAGQSIESGEALLTRILTARREAWEQAELAKMQAKDITPKNDAWKKEYKESTAPEVTSLLELPEGWTWASAESVCQSVHSGTTPERGLLKATEASGVPFIKVYNLTMDGVLDFSVDPTFVDADHHRNRMVRSRTLPGDVLTNIVGPPLGKVSLVPDTHAEWNINQAVAAFRTGSCLLNRFLSIYLQSNVAQSWLRATTKTTTSQVNLAITTCRRLPVPVPPRSEQSRICDEVERLLSNAGAAVSTTDGSMRTSDALRQSVLKAAFEGELVVQDPTDEPASALLERIALECVSAPNTASPKRGRKKKST